MIGHLVAACEAGRRDARAGTRQLSSSFTADRWKAYLAGWGSERRRLAESGQLPQLRLFSPSQDAPQSRLDNA